MPKLRRTVKDLPLLAHIPKQMKSQ